MLLARAPRASRGGFTLLEAVVAAAVIVAAVAALLPTVGQARRQAVVASCLSNLMTLGVGSAQYTQNYNELPGIQGQEGNYWTTPWGRPYLYGGYLSWMTNGLDFKNDFLYADIYPYATSPNPNPPSGYTGLGAVTAYIGTDGKAFYCPGTAASFSDTSAGYPRYGTWTGTPDDGKHGFGRQGRGTETTYFHRGGMYDLNRDLPDGDPRWGGTSNWNWTRDQPVHPGDAAVANKPMLTCFWYGANPQAGRPYWPEWPASNPNLDTLSHGGRQTNLLYTDGSTRTWRLPSNITPIWAWFSEGAYTKGQFRTGSLSEGFIMSGYPSDFYTQAPWWWIEAERANRN